MSKKQKKELRKIIIAGALFAVLLLLEHFVLPETLPYRRWILFALYLIPYAIVGFPVLRKAALGIGHGQVFDESFLMSLATIGAFAVGENAEAAAVMLFYQVGEFFQSYAVGKSRRQISELMEIAPESAFLEEDGQIREVDPDEVPVGSTLVIMPGEKVPIDGIVIDGESMLDTAALTGESVPRTVRAGDAVISGCVNKEGTLRIRTEKAYEDSTVARILELVENASSRKSKTENFISRFAKYYTPVVVIGALLLALVPPLFAGEWEKWLLRACTFLVISCPCALVISVPLSFFGGIGAASRRGILVKGSNYLEQLAYMKTLVTDKTGTLTLGVFKVTSVMPAPGVEEKELLYKTAAAEKMSRHPIALSVLEACPEAEQAKILRSENRSGRGVITETEDGLIYAGNAALLLEEGISFTKAEEKGTVVYTAEKKHGENARFLGAVLISDVIKPGAADALAALRENGTKIVMLTGDRQEAAEETAKALGITDVRAGLLPTQKVEAVEGLLGGAQKQTLAFVGDGLNDAPVLSRADIGIAMGSLGSDAAIEAADVVIMDDDPRKIADAVRIAKKTVRIATENIVFALAVKILILILGALGLAGMWAAVFADVGVAVLAILNAMRCNF